MIGQAIAVGGLGVLALNVYAVVLIVVRSRAWGTRLYRPMLLNVALSTIPILLAIGMIVGTLVLLAAEPGRVRLPVAYLIVSGLAFVVFFPNSVYLITELNFSHRRSDDAVPLWFDIVMTLTLTLSGIVNAIVALAFVQTFAIVFRAAGEIPATPPWWSWAVTAGVLVLGCLGVYLGRRLRFNSWDAARPWLVVSRLVAYLRPRGRMRELVRFVGAHAVLLVVLYVMVYFPIYVLVIGWALDSG
ncbi:hypothetical protein Bcav_1392 [Beutenbergia cavernae DSM 12333]|uniref:DUF1361 domain-containing protein n=1 Tax=Beutenbergia cavernae (strain ATCC BAA-8 / DSM 12333 / CCUG 43141 / JCM 11478 / NBRC 16432 / NCIMB 13614 / HKI 0122) TaxID=471853 RepID=C5C2G5_BEUC1|nr:DUF1361 domain-containing protein [Beutenbergia cavernae]ACQ79651.1 hypothetical protein Bcav_1392 [Beutenbergia cavernae DSM 12333]